MHPIRIGIIGVGNCASSLLQGIEFYRHKSAADSAGLLYWQIGDYRPSDIAVVSAFDIDVRKVGTDVNKAIFADPNCTTNFAGHLAETGVHVSMGKILDGVADHMTSHEDSHTFLPSSAPEPS